MTAKIVRCENCRRPLKTEASRTAGIGPRCAAVKAAEQGLTDRQRDKARQLIEDKAVIPTPRKGMYRIPASDGKTTYLCMPHACTCPWGRKAGKALKAGDPPLHNCAHIGAVRLTICPVIRRRDRRPAYAPAA